MAKLKTKSPLSWAGSDSEVCEQLAARLNDCKHVTITFCGGLSILQYLTARTIVCNDKNAGAINYYRHAKGVFGEECRQNLRERCANTLSHPQELEDAAERVNHPAYSGSWIAAWAFWVQCWLCRKGTGGTKSQGAGMPSVRRTAEGGNNASRLQAVIHDLDTWAEHFKRCEFECLDYEEQLAKVADKQGCALYIDSPWVGAGSMYKHSFSNSKKDKAGQQHKHLRDCLSRFKKTKVLVRYDDDPLVRLLYPEEHWTIEQAECRDRCNVQKPELWITNKRG